MNVNVPCFIFSFQLDKPLDYLNDLMIDALGFELDELVGQKRFEEILTRGSRIFYTTHFYPTLLLEKKIDEIFISFRSKNGDDLPVLLNLSLMRKDGIQHVIGAGFKISKRNSFERRILEAKDEAEKALQENVLLIKTKTELENNRALLEDQLVTMARINKNQNELNKILAHDLQEPIRKIQMFASRLHNLHNAKQSNDKSHSYIERVIRTAKHSHELLKRLQTLHSFEHIQTNYKVAGVQTMIENAMMKIGKVPMNINYGQLEVRTIYGDIHQLTILFVELLKNSYQYRAVERQTTVTISSARITENYHQALEGAYRFIDYIRLKITDNSAGFANYARDDIYKAFQTSNNDSGKGLGLAFCKKIVDLHKGRISVKAAPNGGSEFIIIIPMNPFHIKDQALS